MKKLATYLITAMLAFSSVNTNELCNTNNKSPALVAKLASQAEILTKSTGLINSQQAEFQNSTI